MKPSLLLLTVLGGVILRRDEANKGLGDTLVASGLVGLILGMEDTK